MASTVEMSTFSARLATFQSAHQPSKRRASSQISKKKGGNTIEWPHQQPAVEELARAGFFYRPAQDCPDNVQCFHCSVKLDGWEPADNPLHEHLAHSASCAWAASLSVERPEGLQHEETRDPLSDELVAARKGTFSIGDGWVHQGKRGWRCKVDKMAEAGWVFDPSLEADDGVTCFYCKLSLDGWEPKDDPWEEHKRRSTDCAFFALVEQYHGFINGKTKGKGKGKGRASTASKGSRLNTQSAVSVAVSDAPSTADLGESGLQVDDSIISTASQATVKGKKKAGRPAKGAKGRKRANTVEDEGPPEAQYPELSQSRPSQAPGAFPESSLLEPVEEPAPAPATRATRKGTRQSKQADASIMGVSSMDVAPKKTRGRKAKAKPEPELEPEEHRSSEVSAQLQEELEHSMDLPDNGSTPQQQPPTTKPKRGTKRTSDGIKKEQDSSIVLGIEFPAPPQQAPTKAKRGRKSSKQHALSQEVAPWPEPLPEADEIAVEYPSLADEPVVSEAGVEKPAKKAAKTKKAPAKKDKGKKTSSARSAKATVTASEPEPEHDEAEDLARDEAEIEAELARIAAEQQALVVAEEQERVDEYEPSPSHAERHAKQIQALEEELQAEVEAIPQPSEGMANLVASVAGSPLPRSPQKAIQTLRIEEKEKTTPSPSGSDKENQPSSVMQPATAIKAAPILSPTKTTRIPLAPGTPNRSPRKYTASSPTKPFSQLTSAVPWQPVDLDTVLLASPQPTPGTLAGRLVDVAGGLTSPEKRMSVEEWMRWRAEVGEEDLRRRCEQAVGVFEREGVRAMECLGGIDVVV